MVDDDGRVSFRQTQCQVGGADQQLASVKVKTLAVILIHGNFLLAPLAGWLRGLRKEPPAGSPFECGKIGFERMQFSRDLGYWRETETGARPWRLLQRIVRGNEVRGYKSSKKIR
jgi:hypothetical protein